MKLKTLFVSLALVATGVRGQGFLVIDQQSTNIIEGGAALNIIGQPMGQSFTPTLSSISFFLLNLYDADSLHNLGGTIYVNVRSNSVTGQVLGSSLTVELPDQFFGSTNFIFSIPVSVIPGTTYYFQPVVQVGNGWGSIVTDGSYAGGTLYQDGLPLAGRNLWFQEGIIAVPEPSTLALTALGALLLACRHRKN